MDKLTLDLNDRTAAIDAIKQLGIDELRFLNRAIVERLKLLQQESYSEHMAQFSVGDRVSFTDKSGDRQIATVLKLNKKTVGLITDEDEHWNVAPQLLELETQPDKSVVIDIVPGGRPNRGSTPHSALPLAAKQVIEWVGGVILMPGYVTGEGPAYRPKALIWMDSEQLVVGMSVQHPDEVEDELIESLRIAIRSPMVGDPRTPDRIRIADAELVGPLRAAFSGIEFIQAPTPELIALTNSMHESAADEPCDAATFLSSGATPAAVGSMFNAAADFFRAAPWQIIPHDQCLIGVSIPSLSIECAVISVVGKHELSYGFLYFSTLLDHERYLWAADRLRRMLEADTPAYTALSFEPGAEIDSEIRKEIAEYGWEVADVNAYPGLFTPDVDRMVRPLTESDITLVELLCRSLPVLIETLGDAEGVWQSSSPVKSYPISPLADGEPYEVQFTVPFPFHQVLHGDLKGSELLASLMVHGRSSDDVDLDEIRPLYDELDEDFRQSPEGSVIGNGQIDISRLIVDFAANYLNETIATLLPEGLEEILLEIVPQKVSIGAEDAKGVIHSAHAFYQYLKREHGLLQADVCLEILNDKAVEELEAALSDSGNFGIAKSVVNLGKQAGFDTSTPEGMDEFMHALNRGDVGGLDDIFLPGMPMPESSLKTDKPINKKARKDKRKAARKARRKNR